jgi:hypothetical protein
VATAETLRDPLPMAPQLKHLADSPMTLGNMRERA